MQTVPCENHFFESRLFGLSELHLALLGSSRPLPGQSWGPDGTQNPPKATPKLDRKWVQKGIQFWAALGPILGSVLGPKSARGAHFSRFFGVSPEPPSGPILASFWLLPGLSWAHLGPNLAPLGPILASFWPHLGPLGLSCRLLGLFLALSWLS